MYISIYWLLHAYIIPVMLAYTLIPNAKFPISQNSSHFKSIKQYHAFISYISMKNTPWFHDFVCILPKTIQEMHLLNLWSRGYYL